MRYYNGECADFANEAVATIAALSLALKKGLNFEDYETAVKSVEQECINVSTAAKILNPLSRVDFCSVNGS